MRLAIDDDLAAGSEAPWLSLAARHTMVLWDSRGVGLSSTSTPEYTLESSVRDMEVVADAVQIDHFHMLAHLTPCHPAIAYAARHRDRVRRMVLWNPSPPGSSMRATTLDGLPDIARSHFKEYMQLAALRSIGWERGSAAKRWVEHICRNFTVESWDRLMDQMETIDATSELTNVTARTLVIAEAGADPAPMHDNRRLFRQQLAASMPNAELVTMKADGTESYAEIAARFFLADDETVALRGSGTAIILFADIADSTALTERHGDAAFRERSRALDDALRAAVRDNGGAVVDAKTLGDGILATFPAASQAIVAALACARTGDAAGLPLHVGLHAGDVIRESDNVFGGAVNIANRISVLAAPGEVLVSATVRDLGRTSSGVAFEDRGKHMLKGITEPQRVFAVRPAG
jgi:class 3 adenylate cyclase